MLPRVLLVSLGGTITMTPGADSTIAPSLTAADLVAAVPALAQHARIEASTFLKLPGASLTLTQLIELAAYIEAQLTAGYDGVVVVQGTDTIEETAFVLDLLVRSDAPVVVTGAMRGAQMAGADGPANLLAATVVAASPQARGLGTLVVLNDTVHAARYVQKTHTGAPSAFASPHAGPVGLVAEDAAHILMRAARSPALPAAPSHDDAPVALLMLGLGDDGRLIPALPGLGFRGAVVAGMGAGHVPALMAEPLQALAAAMPVVLATRVTAGPGFRSTYGFTGSETDLLGRGLWACGHLPAIKARLLLALLLRCPLPPDVARQAFHTIAAWPNGAQA